MTKLNYLKQVSSEIKINKERDWLFDYTQDFSERIKWDKQTRKIEFIGQENKLKKGSLVYTESKEGIGMDTEYLIFKKPEKISIKMINKSNIFKSFIGKWDYIKLDNDITVLKITYQFNLRFPYNLIAKTVQRKIKNNMVSKLNYLSIHLKQDVLQQHI